jgi:hypothetical protein
MFQVDPRSIENGGWYHQICVTKLVFARMSLNHRIPFLSAIQDGSRNILSSLPERRVSNLIIDAFFPSLSIPISSLPSWWIMVYMHLGCVLEGCIKSRLRTVRRGLQAVFDDFSLTNVTLVTRRRVVFPYVKFWSLIQDAMRRNIVREYMKESSDEDKYHWAMNMISEGDGTQLLRIHFEHTYGTHLFGLAEGAVSSFGYDEFDTIGGRMRVLCMADQPWTQDDIVTKDGVSDNTTEILYLMIRILIDGPSRRVPIKSMLDSMVSRKYAMGCVTRLAIVRWLDDGELFTDVLRKRRLDIMRCSESKDKEQDCLDVLRLHFPSIIPHNNRVRFSKTTPILQIESVDSFIRFNYPGWSPHNRDTPVLRDMLLKEVDIIKNVWKEWTPQLANAIFMCIALLMGGLRYGIDLTDEGVIKDLNAGLAQSLVGEDTHHAVSIISSYGLKSRDWILCEMFAFTMMHEDTVFPVIFSGISGHDLGLSLPDEIFYTTPIVASTSSVIDTLFSSD